MKKQHRGVSGKFNIVLRTNQNTIYEVKFKSKTQKPQNLKFEIENTNIKANNLEELENYLKGRINKGEEKTISIKWSWEYENSIKNNIQDTKDAMKIESYKFEIFATGEEIIQERRNNPKSIKRIIKFNWIKQKYEQKDNFYTYNIFNLSIHMHNSRSKIYQ